MWEIEFYVKPNGRCPAREFLNSLSVHDDVPFVDRMFSLLAEYGHELRRPYVDFLQEDIWELRVKTRRGQIRFLYLYFMDKRIVITHGIIKKASKVPVSEIKKAIEYRSDYLSQYKA